MPALDPASPPSPLSLDLKVGRLTGTLPVQGWREAWDAALARAQAASSELNRLRARYGRALLAILILLNGLLVHPRQSRPLVRPDATAAWRAGGRPPVNS